MKEMKIFENKKELEKYYNKETNTYEFKENGEYIDVKFDFDLDIGEYNINANDIDACDIIFYASCIARETFKCKSIRGRRKNNIIKCLDNEIEYKKD